MGLQEIFFVKKKTELGLILLGIMVNFLFINRNYEIHGLNKLTESNRNFLLAITFSYLRAIKNRGEEKIIFLNEPQLTESTEENEDEKFCQKVLDDRWPVIRFSEFWLLVTIAMKYQTLCMKEMSSSIMELV